MAYLTRLTTCRNISQGVWSPDLCEIDMVHCRKCRYCFVGMYTCSKLLKSDTTVTWNWLKNLILLSQVPRKQVCKPWQKIACLEWISVQISGQHGVDFCSGMLSTPMPYFAVWTLTLTILLTFGWLLTIQNSQTFTLCSKQNWFVTFLLLHLQRPIFVSWCW